MKAPKITEAKQQIFDTVAGIASTLGSSTRLKTLYILAQAPRSVDTIAEITGESVANISQHLQKLLNEGLVAVRKEKLSRIYRLAEPEIALFIEDLFDLAERVSPRLVQITSALHETDGEMPLSLHSVIDDIKKKKATLLDVREEYEASHSPVEGALSVPMTQLEKKAGSLAKGKTYYLFCRGRACELATEGVRLLRSLGFKAFRLKENPSSLQLQTRSGKK
jgi:DNA-binding transcriptional ArsR family regulator/rhodanese-related sulfurtransferase